MGAQSAYWYSCDECGWNDSYTSPGHNKRAARQEATKVGWKFPKGKAICPECLGKKKQ